MDDGDDDDDGNFSNDSVAVTTKKTSIALAMDYRHDFCENF